MAGFRRIIVISAFFHAVGIRLSDKHLVYSLASVLEMVSSPVFNVSMFIWSLPVNNNNNIFIWYSATSIIVRGASQHITI